MIAFRDFLPQIESRRMLGMLAEYEDVNAMLDRANQWIAESDLRVLNVETLLVPRRYFSETEELQTQLEPVTHNVAWSVQVIRVWYQR
ncbi:MAG TPA: hypothetical protein VD886_02980 [Herpetosiphonaceae bacterium]|nr:hypothetical protein [Herpetosiphonaceae bacterium]